jgi:hypothetical protein
MTLPPPRLTRKPEPRAPLRGFLDDAPRRVLAHPDESARVLPTEYRLDAPNEVRLFVQSAPGHDEGPSLRPGLLRQLPYAARPEVHALGREEGVRAALHYTMVSLHAASGEQEGPLVERVVEFAQQLVQPHPLPLGESGEAPGD